MTTRRLIVLSGLLGALCLGLAFPKEVLDSLRPVPIQHGGRLKPLDSFARETLDRITGAPQYGNQDPVETIFSIVAEPERWQEIPTLSVPYIPLREALGLGRRTALVSYNRLLADKKLMGMLPSIIEKQKQDERLTLFENEAMDLYDRFGTFSGLIEQQLHLVPPKQGNVWLPVSDFGNGWQDFLKALRTGEPVSLEVSAHRLAQQLRRANPAAYPAPWRLRLEVLYNRLNPLRLARILYLGAFLILLLGMTRGGQTAFLVGMMALWAGFLIHGAGILTRTILSGRPPVSNFYESMLWLSFVAVALALLFGRIYKVGFFGLTAGLLAAIVLLLADHLPLDSSISPVIAVLRSSLWLTIHVLTIVASYGALALATVLAHIHGIAYLARPTHRLLLTQLSTFLYRTIQMGVVLLAAGIMLGAVWANASWGRYWGWDPKETWALITLLWFLAVLHGRFAGWLNGVGVALATIGGFFLLLMTYYGVSFYLAGLHSYAGGHAKPLPPLLLVYLAAEILFMSLVGWAAIKRRRPAS